MTELFIGLVGAVGSGKSSSIEAIESVVGNCHKIKMSDLISEDLRESGEPVNRQTLRARGNLRRAQLRGYWMHLVYARCRGLPSPVALIDGIRNLDEIAVLKESSESECYIVAFPASAETRARRMTERQRAIDGDTFQSIMEVIEDEMRDESPNGLQVSKCIAAADYIVNAELPLEQANDEVARIIAMIYKAQC